MVFDPIELSKAAEKAVCRARGGVVERKYTGFHVVGVYQGISTGYVCGCNLRCFFCWSHPCRDQPERYGGYHSPESAFRVIERLAARSGVRRARLSGGEPTLCWRHLTKLIELADESRELDLFILETNGILLGFRPELAEDLACFRKLVVRVSIKAGTPEGFSWKTGAAGWAFELPFKAIERLLSLGVRVYPAAVLDPRVTWGEDRREVFRRLGELGYELVLDLEDESIDPYPNALRRMRRAGVELEWADEKVEVRYLSKLGDLVGCSDLSSDP